MMAINSAVMCLKVFVLLNLFFVVSSYKILALFPHPGKSHVDVFLPLMRALAEKGHQVTVVSHFPLKTPIDNYTDINIGDSTTPWIDILSLENYKGRRVEKYMNIYHLNGFARYSCRIGYQSNNFQKFLASNSSFELVVAEFFNSDCFLGLVHKFKVPLIGISSSTIMPWMEERFANPAHPAYIPVNIMDYSDRMTFLERVENLLVGVIYSLIYKMFMISSDELIVKEFLGENILPLRDVIYNTSLFLINTHFSLNHPRPLVPAVIEVGGIHLNKPKKLPLDLEKWISDSLHGVIYFSLGSMIKGHTFPEDKRQEFLRAFGRLPQRVLWKWENDSMPGQPDNVMIRKWMPQLDILCHPNVRAFISHGGLLGTIEAVHCGVPVVVMPQFGDQHTNARALEANGGGVILHLHDANEEKVYKALKTVLDPEFRKGAQELSARFKDRPLPPLETAIYWVEYVARHKGAHHMRTAAVDMPLYQYLLLDVIAFLLVVISVFFAIVFYTCRALLRKAFGGRRNKRKTN